VQQVDVQRVALDPFAAVDESPESAQRAVDANAARVLHRMDSAHLVRDWTDAADTRGDVWRFGEVAPAQECLEETRRLKNFQLHTGDFTVLDLDPHRTLAFDPRKIVDFNRTRLTHASRFLCERRRRMR